MIISTSLKKKKNSRLVKNLIKQETPKKPTKDNSNKLNKWVNKKETDINRELFNKHFKFQRPSDMLKSVYTTNDRKKNDDLVNLIRS